MSGRASAGWRLIELLGRGGTAEVWRAVDAAGHEAALKILRAELRAERGAADFLRREHDWLRALAGAPFVASLGLVSHQGAPALALEYLPGGDLVPLLGGPLPHWLPALRAVAAALAALHARGAAHGDLKPRNVLFAADGGARVIDLTAVRPLEAAAARTTAAYRPAGEHVTAGDADCFALAALAFELLTGRLPFGSTGQGFVGEEPGGGEAAAGPAATLHAAARRALADGGRRGLSPLLDVIESVDAG